MTETTNPMANRIWVTKETLEIMGFDPPCFKQNGSAIERISILDGMTQCATYSIDVHDLVEFSVLTIEQMQPYLDDAEEGGELGVLEVLKVESE